MLPKPTFDSVYLQRLFWKWVLPESRQCFGCGSSILPFPESVMRKVGSAVGMAALQELIYTCCIRKCAATPAYYSTFHGIFFLKVQLYL